MKTYNELLNISENECKIPLVVKKSGKLVIANTYNRVVIGKRGPYVEFTKNQIYAQGLYIPTKQLYRLSDPKVYYIEFRTTEGNAKVYYQMRTVAYADYKIEHFYISPIDLETEDGIPCINEEVDIYKNAEEFFQFD